MLFSETFKFNVEALPHLYAYRLQIIQNGESVHSIGGKVAYRFKSRFGVHWVWDRATWRVIGDVLIDEKRISELLAYLWTDADNSLHGLQAVTADPDWSPVSYSLAQWVAFAFLPDFQRSAMRELSDFDRRIGDILINREYKVKPWVVRGARTSCKR